MLARDSMSRDTVTVTPDDTLADALRLTREHRVRHLPVLSPDRTIAGILSDRDIRLAMPSPLTVADEERAAFLERTPISAVMSRSVITVQETEPLESAAVLLSTHRIGCVPVVDPENRLVGILTETDILRSFVQLLSGRGRTTRLEILLPDSPGQLATAARIVGDELGLNIASIIVVSGDQPRKTAILHVETIDPRQAIERLRAGGYEVGWPSLEAPFDEERAGA